VTRSLRKAPPTRRYAPRGRRVQTVKNQRSTFRNIEFDVATLTAGSGSLTNLNTLIEQTVSGPDIELNRALFVSVNGLICFRPTAVGTVGGLHLGLLTAPDTIDNDDLDIGAEGVLGHNYWWQAHRPYRPNAHLRSVTATTFENETDPINIRVRTRGTRRLRGFGEALFLKANAIGNGATDLGGLLNITVEFP